MIADRILTCALEVVHGWWNRRLDPRHKTSGQLRVEAAIYMVCGRPEMASRLWNAASGGRSYVDTQEPTPAQAEFIDAEQSSIWCAEHGAGKTWGLVYEAVTVARSGGDALLFRFDYDSMQLPDGIYDTTVRMLTGIGHKTVRLPGIGWQFRLNGGGTVYLVGLTGYSTDRLSVMFRGVDLAMAGFDDCPHTITGPVADLIRLLLSRVRNSPRIRFVSLPPLPAWIGASHADA